MLGYYSGLKPTLRAACAPGTLMLALEADASNAWTSAALCAGGVAKRRGL